MLRILLFLGTNAAVLVVASITMRLLGVESYIQDGELNLTSLLIFCGIFGMAGSLISLFLSKFIAKKTARVTIITSPKTEYETWLMATVNELSQKAGIKPPEVGVFPSSAPNAFATGWNKNAALVAVSEGLLQQFPRDEVRAILGHEIAHVANGDMVTLALVQGVVNTFVLFLARIIGYVVDKAIFKNENGHGMGFYIVTFVAEIVLGILASIIVMWFSRYREFRADAGGASLADRNAMIRSLERLRSISYNEPLPDALNAFGIKRSRASKLGELFATHPPLEKRISALRSA